MGKQGGWWVLQQGGTYFGSNTRVRKKLVDRGIKIGKKALLKNLHNFLGSLVFFSTKVLGCLSGCPVRASFGETWKNDLILMWSWFHVKLVWSWFDVKLMWSEADVKLVWEFDVNLMWCEARWSDVRVWSEVGVKQSPARYLDLEKSREILL